jgi:hypothetical protein
MALATLAGDGLLHHDVITLAPSWQDIYHRFHHHVWAYMVKQPLGILL